MRLFALALAAAAFLLPPAPASAQRVQVEVSASESGAPLRGVFVSLLDRTGRVVRSGLTNEAGRLVLLAGAPGSFRVKAELIGRATVTSDFLAVPADGSAGVPLSLPFHAIALGEIRVEAEPRCSLRPAEATELARVWEEARKPLAVQAWAEREGLYRLRIATWERDLDRTGRTVERESRRGASRVTRAPFATLPVEDLLSGGFVRALEGGGHQYFAPDAALLLSDAFLDTHCFRLVRSEERRGQIGLSFEPQRAGRPDVRGTLWIDEATSALRLIEYAYTESPYPEAEGVAGGRVELEALPDGGWMIARWWIRAPLLARHASLASGDDSGIRVQGIRETGGEVTSVSTLQGRSLSVVQRGSLGGVVWDSTRSAPLSRAVVRLDGTGFRAETDARGAFVLSGLPEGVFTVSFAHPRLDSLGVELAGREAVVVPGRSSDIALAIPSMASILLAACVAEETGAGGGAVLSGSVTDARGHPIPGARVRVDWQDVERTAPAVRARDRWLEGGTDAAGRYTICGLPVDEALRVRASLLDRRSSVAELRFARAEHRALDLVVALPAAGGGAAARAGEPGAQGVQGVLVERDSGKRIRSAEVSVRTPSGTVLASAVTDARGFFRLQVPDSGAYRLSARALGYGGVEDEPVGVSLGELSVVEVQMVPEALELEPIVVTAERRVFHLEMQGFYTRRQEGAGRFVPPEVMEKRDPGKLSDVLRGVPGVFVAEYNTGLRGAAVYFRSGLRADSFSGNTLNPGSVCWPMVFVDRHPASLGGLVAGGADPAMLDELVHPSDVWAMEVYRSPSEIPSEFGGQNAGCGVIVIWTKGAGGG